MGALRFSLVVAAIACALAVARAEDAPDQDSASAPDAPAPVTTGPVAAPGPVTIGDLNVVDGPAVGLIDDTSGGLGQGMWSASQRGDLEVLLDDIPINSDDGVIRELSRRILLTTSDTPIGPGKRALVTIRIEKLLEGGWLDNAADLAAKAQVSNDPDFSRVKARAILLAGRATEACTDATAQRLTDGDAFWLQLRAWCYAAGGDDAQADLIDQLLEAQDKSDALFRLLRDDVLKHRKTLPANLTTATPMQVFLMKAAGVAIPDVIADKLHLAPRQGDDEAASSSRPGCDALDPMQEQRHYALCVGLADVLGDPLPQEVRDAAGQLAAKDWPGDRPRPAYTQVIDQAAAQPGRKGEAILRILEVLESHPLGDMAPDVTIKIVGMLHAFGLDSEAKLIAARALRDYREPPPPSDAPAQ